jgi:polyphosphate kinase
MPTPEEQEAQEAEEAATQAAQDKEEKSNKESMSLGEDAVPPHILKQIKKYCDKLKHNSYRYYETCIKTEARNYNVILEQYMQEDEKIVDNCKLMYRRNYRQMKICIQKELRSKDRTK